MSGRRAIAAVAGAAVSLLAAHAGADPDEAWVRRAAVAPGVHPLLVLLVDTSESMAASIGVPLPYDPSRQYTAGDCSPGRVYWRRGPGPVPDCAGVQWVSAAGAGPDTGWRCAAGGAALSTTGLYIASRAAQWEPRPGGGYWRALRPGDDGAVECRADRGSHGSGPGTWYAVESAGAPWSSQAADEIRWDAPPLSDAYIFFSGNYLNYLAGAAPTATVSLYEWLARQVVTAAASVHELDIALARLSHEGSAGDAAAEGGMVVLAGNPLPAGAGGLASRLAQWQPAGPAPLGEALAEVAAWLAGQPVVFGLDSSAAPGDPLPSAAESRDPLDPAVYLSPVVHACRPVTIGLLTAGVASADAGAAAGAARLPGFESDGCAGDCLPQIAGWLAAQDLLPRLPGRQFASVRLLAPAPAPELVRRTAGSTGRRAIDALDPLAAVMLLAEALQHDAAAGLPYSGRVGRAGYLREQGAAFFGLSQPTYGSRWRGNLRRYRLVPGDSPLAGPVVLDRNGLAAFDPLNGLPLPLSWSVWSDAPDGSSPLLGGAAERLPPSSERRLYSDLAEAPLSSAANRIGATNTLLTRESLGLSAGDGRTLTELVEWLLGRDAFDEDFDDDTRAPRADIGDPGLNAPAVVRYADADDVLFFASADGFLHALGAEDGLERWAFLPRPLLARAAQLASGLATATRTRSLDGGLTISVSDTDADGRIDAAQGDSAHLFVGLGRESTGYYALDVSDPGRPALLWSLLPEELPGFARSRPAPVVAPMSIDPDRQAADRLVVVLSGGYDPAEPVEAPTGAGPGAALAILDARSGELLWTTGGAGESAPEAMRYSFPSAPRIIDRDGDGLADLLYALDLAGQLWRVDVVAAQADRPATLEMSRLASLGRTEGEPARRFFHTPDVVYAPRKGASELIIAFGSGRLTRPRESVGVDRFYAVFDSIAGPRAGDAPLTEADLDEVPDTAAALPPHSRGWKRRLDALGPGEKTSGAASTFDHRLRFTTHRPLPPAPDEPCGPPRAENRLYTLDVRNGRAWRHVGEEEAPSEEIPTTGLPPELRIVFPADRGSDCPTADCAAPVLLWGGLSRRIDFLNLPVRTSWRELDVTAD